ncbi:hypothetical protein [Flavobacterium kingsejongi]
MLFVFFSLHTFAQDAAISPEKYTAHNKGKFFFYWGGNRAHFSKSDITFRGDNYNFTIKDVEAHDKPKGYHIDYLNPARMTIPQTNFRMGYYINDHYNISIGVDHMKYVMNQYQTVNMDGQINLPADAEGAAFNGNYNNSPMVMTPEFLAFEHTDGLNYVNIEIARVDDISTKLFNWDSDKIQINLTEAVGAGLLYPKTNAQVLGMERHDDFHVSGYGLSAKGGLNITFLKYFFVQGELKGGYINMQDIQTTHEGSDSAFQDFFFVQTNLVFGGIFRI